jgi:SP family sugar:H+ symporter-like MFS transporter
MLEETTPRDSSKWVPASTFASEMGVDEKGALKAEVVEDIRRRGSAI